MDAATSETISNCTNPFMTGSSTTEENATHIITWITLNHHYGRFSNLIWKMETKPKRSYATTTTGRYSRNYGKLDDESLELEWDFLQLELK